MGVWVRSHQANPPEDALRPPAPGGDPISNGSEHRPQMELPKLVLLQHGEQARSARKLRERRIVRPHRREVPQSRGGHAEAETLPVDKSVGPAEDFSSAGPIGNRPELVSEPEAVTGRIEAFEVVHLSRVTQPGDELHVDRVPVDGHARLSHDLREARVGVDGHAELLGCSLDQLGEDALGYKVRDVRPYGVHT